MLVVDASFLAPALADSGDAGDLIRRRLGGERVAGPELLDLEVTAVIRKQLRLGELDLPAAQAALDDLSELPIRRVPHRGLLARCWQLRDNLTMYDASYVAAAELLGVSLITADRRLSRGPGIRCPVELLA